MKPIHYVLILAPGIIGAFAVAYPKAWPAFLGALAIAHYVAILTHKPGAEKAIAELEAAATKVPGAGT